LYRTGPVVAAIGVALALVLAACGGGGSSSSGTGASADGGSPTGAGTTTTGATTPGVATSPASRARDVERAGTTAKRKGAAHPTTSGGGCEARLGDLVDRMDDLRQSLLAGLDYSEYVLRVQAIRAAYEAVPVDRLGLACVAGAANHAEAAFNQYLRAANLWGECAGTKGCAASSIESRLQHRWKVASKSLDAAKSS
jgi:hypothetical protein